MEKLELDLELILPPEAGERDACAARIVDSLKAKPGITDAHIETASEGRPKLCLHYDPGAIRLDRVRWLVEEAGAELARRFEHLSIPVTGLRHERQASLVEEVLRKEPGVLQAAVSFGTGRVAIEFEPGATSRAALLDAIGRAGIALAPEVRPVDASKEEHEQHEHEVGPFGERSELIFSLACGALTGIGWALAKFGGLNGAATALFVVAYVLGAWFTVQEVFVAIRARRFEIDFLMLLAAAGAAFLGEWLEGALLLFLFTLGHALEGFAMGRAKRAIEALSKLVPDTALLIADDGGEREVPVEQLNVGARVLVKPNSRIPADGFVEQGTSSVNQSPITGESVPVEKRPADDAGAAERDPAALPPENRVFAGTINGPSALTIRVTKMAGESTLARVVKMVSEVETQKSASQRFTDRFERVFVPVIIGVVALLLFAWVVVDEPFTASFYRAMAVLVAASPCALAIATPSAVLSGVARAARGGVLVKGGAHLESLGAVRVFAFDKTGTLTEGKPRLTDVRAASGVADEELLRVALSVEKQSDHPLASAIVSGAAERLGDDAVPDAADVEAIIGFGIKATVNGARVQIGKAGLFTQEAPLPPEIAAAVDQLQRDGRTVMIVQRDAQFLGVIGVMDTPRESARRVIEELHALGVEQTIMLSGDNQRVAEAVAKEVGIREARGDLLPEQKVALIAELARGSRRVAMVGDGVNDAPAMANATVGIAMGAGGSDVALETADVALMADDLQALPFATGLSRAARRIIRQNLWASLGMVAFLMPATIFGFAGIGLAVTLHEGSTLLVVANALRLLAYRDGRDARIEGAAELQSRARGETR